MKLDAEKIPAELQPFIPMAEKWGHQDIDVREQQIEKATTQELLELASMWDIYVGLISHWLAEPQVRAEPTTDEYVAFTCLILAVSSAKHRLDHLDQE